MGKSILDFTSISGRSGTEFTQVKGRSGTVFWCKPYILTLSSKPTGVDTITCYRYSSLQPGAATGPSAVLTNGSTIYHGDVIYISATASSGYKAPSVSSSTGTITSNKLTVNGNESITITAGELDVVPYLTFSSPNSFTLKIGDNTKHWDGTLEYSTDTSTWNIWDGTTTLSSGSDNKLYLRGTGNTVIAGITGFASFVLTGSNVSCVGNIENLLDYQTVSLGNHPTMSSYCYSNMFDGCTSLTTAPALPATTLAAGCYSNMFYGCTSLTTAPALPATTLASYCYSNMFDGCTSLTTAPALPATTLASYCYQVMFSGCTSLTTAPALPATTLASSCYQLMFSGCTSLTTAPALPATTLASYCYSYMFRGCTSLTTAPALPSTTLASSCYSNMFYGCTSLTTAPALPATRLVSRCYSYMFSECTSLIVSNTSTSTAKHAWRIPVSGTFKTSVNQAGMFYNCAGTRSSDSMAGKASESYTYYTQNAQIS